MTPPILRRPLVIDDLIEQYIYIAMDNPNAAERFLDTTEKTFRQLTQTPMIGTARRFNNPDLKGIRMWPIPGFEYHLIFYRPLTDGIEIIRVLHAARDIKSILENE